MKTLCNIFVFYFLKCIWYSKIKPSFAKPSSQSGEDLFIDATSRTIVCLDTSRCFAIKVSDIFFRNNSETFSLRSWPDLLILCEQIGPVEESYGLDFWSYCKKHVQVIVSWSFNKFSYNFLCVKCFTKLHLQKCVRSG